MPTTSPSTRPSVAATLLTGAAAALLAGLLLTGAAHPGAGPDRHLAAHLHPAIAHSTTLDWSGGCGGSASYNSQPC